MTKNFDELNDTFNVSSEIVTTSAETLKASFNSSKFLVIR